MTEENLAARSRRLTEEALASIEKKMRAGEWYPVDAVRTIMVRVINRYEGLLEITEGKLEHMYDLCDSYENLFAGEEEE
jgi:hypothetical protein